MGIVSTIFTDFSVELLVIALIIGFYKTTKMKKAKASDKADKMLSWMLLLAVGFSFIYAGFFQAADPVGISAEIGFTNSPFLFELAMSNIATGLIAVLSFWRSLDFKKAVAMISSIFLLGAFVGHIYQIVYYQNYAPGNAGIILWTDIIIPIILVALIFIAKKPGKK